MMHRGPSSELGLRLQPAAVRPPLDFAWRRAASPRVAVLVARLSLLALPLLLCACGRPAGDTSWFPLEAGHRWTYRVTTELDNDATEHEALQLETLGRVDLGDRPAWLRRSSGGASYWLRSDETGIYRVASKSELDAEPEADPAPRYVLKAPYATGTQWQSTTTAYVLQRRNDFPREIRHTHPKVNMLYQIDAVQQRVDTPAGRFEGCLRVRGSASVRLYTDPTAGWKDVPLNTTEWYCPGVGLARLERHEPGGTGFLVGGRLTMELAAWH